MSMYSIYFDKIGKRMMKYDSAIKSIFWEKTPRNIRVNNSMRELNNIIDEDIKSKEDDIDIVLLNKNNFLLRKRAEEGYMLYNDDQFIGLLDISLGPQKVEEIRLYGGLLIRVKDDSSYKVTYYRIREGNPMKAKFDNDKTMNSGGKLKDKPYYEKNILHKETSDISQQTFFDDKNNKEQLDALKSNKDDYYETTIRIPFPKHTLKDNEVEKLLHMSKIIHDKVTSIEGKLQKNDYTNESTEIMKYKSMYNNIINENGELRKKLNYLLKEKSVLSENLSSIANERKYLINEIEKAELVALNDFKKKLKPAIVNINSQIDLEEQRNIYDEILDIIKMCVGKDDIEKITQNKDINYKIKYFSSNIDTKILVLQEIKDLFNKLNVLETDRGDN